MQRHLPRVKVEWFHSHGTKKICHHRPTDKPVSGVHAEVQRGTEGSENVRAERGPQEARTHGVQVGARGGPAPPPDGTLEMSTGPGSGLPRKKAAAHTSVDRGLS